MVRFTDLPTGEAAGYAAVTEHEGLRLSTEPFRMPDDSGMRGQILALRRTSDPSVLRLDPRSKMIVDLREEALAVMIGLFFRNVSQEIFDPGEQGLIIPMPEGAVNAQEIEGGEPLEIVPGKGIRIRSIIPPDSAASFISTARYGYILPTDGARDRRAQPGAAHRPARPVHPGAREDRPGAGGPGLQARRRTTSTAPATRSRCSPRPRSPPAAPWPSPSPASRPATRTGRTVAACLCVLLIAGALAGVLACGAGRQAAAGGTGRDDLIARREQLFAELVELDRERKARRATRPARRSPQAADRRAGDRLPQPGPAGRSEPERAPAVSSV